MLFRTFFAFWNSDKESFFVVIRWFYCGVNPASKDKNCPISVVAFRSSCRRQTATNEKNSRAVPDSHQRDTAREFFWGISFGDDGKANLPKILILCQNSRIPAGGTQEIPWRSLVVGGRKLKLYIGTRMALPVSPLLRRLGRRLLLSLTPI